MFTIFNDSEQLVPIKVWLPNEDDLDETCLQQALNLSNLPFAFRHIALMPDTHTGYGMPIGGIFASSEVIIPNAVGVDIGCGMGFIHTNVPIKVLRETKTPNGSLAQYFVGQIMRSVPQGFEHHKQKQQSEFLNNYPVKQLYNYGVKHLPKIDEAHYQIGTLGGGNHFIELQEDEEGFLGIMVHTGSRNLGYKIANYFNRLAKTLNKKMGSAVPPQFDLAYLPINSEEARGYIGWMNFALEFAKHNRALIIGRVQDIVFDGLKRFAGIDDIKITMEVNAHHNYAAFENHFGRDVWVHRKGAIRAGKDEYGIIPGAMGSFSYIVKGKGNPESFCSCSHGAGRVMSRSEAVKQFSVQEVVEDLKSQNVVLGKLKRSDVAEESRWAYKDIETVISYQQDLVEPVLRLRTAAVVKG